MPFRARIAEVTRMTDLEGRTLCFKTPTATRGRSRVDFIDKDSVPEFEGDSAWFEIVKRRVPESPWPRWTVVRRVDGPDLNVESFG